MSYYILARRQKSIEDLALSDIFSKYIIGVHAPTDAVPVEYDVEEDKGGVSDVDTEIIGVENVVATISGARDLDADPSGVYQIDVYAPGYITVDGELVSALELSDDSYLLLSDSTNLDLSTAPVFP